MNVWTTTPLMKRGPVRLWGNVWGHMTFFLQQDLMTFQTWCLFKNIFMDTDFTWGESLIFENPLSCVCDSFVNSVDQSALVFLFLSPFHIGLLILSLHQNKLMIKPKLWVEICWSCRTGPELSLCSLLVWFVDNGEVLILAASSSLCPASHLLRLRVFTAATPETVSES